MPLPMNRKRMIESMIDRQARKARREHSILDDPEAPDYQKQRIRRVHAMRHGRLRRMYGIAWMVCLLARDRDGSAWAYVKFATYMYWVTFCVNTMRLVPYIGARAAARMFSLMTGIPVKGTNHE